VQISRPLSIRSPGEILKSVRIPEKGARITVLSRISRAVLTSISAPVSPFVVAMISSFFRPAAMRASS